MDLEDVVYKLTAEVAALTATVRENNNFLRDFIEAQRHCNQLVEEKIRYIELHGSQKTEDALKQLDVLSKDTNDRFGRVLNRLETIEAKHTSESAVFTWWDHWIVKLAVVIGMLVTAINFAKDFVFN